MATLVLDRIFEPYHGPATYAVPIICDWCDRDVEGTIEIGSVNVCVPCIENAENDWEAK